MERTIVVQGIQVTYDLEKLYFEVNNIPYDPATSIDVSELEWQFFIASFKSSE